MCHIDVVSHPKQQLSPNASLVSEAASDQGRAPFIARSYSSASRVFFINVLIVDIYKKLYGKILY